MSSHIGKPVPRFEDARLLTGNGEFSDDFNLPGQAYAFVARSPHAHAIIDRIDTSAAKDAPGVIAVLTCEDYISDGLAPMPAWGNPKDVELKNRNGADVFYTPLYPLARNRVRRTGEPVALVLAGTASQAEDAAQLLDVQYRPLAAVTDARDALAGGAPQIWDQVAGNISVDDEKGDKVATDAAFTEAAHVVAMDIFNNRVTGVPMEPRAALAIHDSAHDQLTLYTGGQGVVRFQAELAHVFDMPKEMLRVVSRDVGGGYGTRNHTYSEFALVLWAAKHTGGAVKWTCGRGDAFLSDYAGRDLFTRAELALAADGRFLAMRTENISNIGTHTVSFVPLARGPTVTNGVYELPTAHVISKAVFTNTSPTASYRGAGRPESMFVLERLIDHAAAVCGFDRIELRRRNMIRPTLIPYANPLGVSYDSGDFGTGMEMALELSDWAGFPARRAEARARGRFSGIGLANYIETATGYPVERAEMLVRPEGGIDLVIGTQSSGQGHETSYAQVVAEYLGVPMDCITLLTGDTDLVRAGSGSHSSRSMRLAGLLFRRASDEIIAQGNRIAGHLLEAAPEDIAFHDGRFTIVGTDRGMNIFAIAAAAAAGDLPEGLSGPLGAAAEIDTPLPSYPNGCHVAEVEVDPDTGTVEIVRYTGIDDVGRVINPLIVDGQTHGGIAQGAGQALMEDCTFDSRTGQVLAGTFMDYAMPRADIFPTFDLEFNEVPAPSTPLGVKGGGEGGATGAPPAIVNAICDALLEFGVTHIEMPATPERVWRAMTKNPASTQ